MEMSFVRDENEATDVNPLLNRNDDEFIIKESNTKSLHLRMLLHAVATQKSRRNRGFRKCKAAVLASLFLMSVGVFFHMGRLYFDGSLRDDYQEDVCISTFNMSPNLLIESVFNSDNLCYDKEQTKCECESTVEPKLPSRDKDFIKRWKKATRRNKRSAKEPHDGPYDVVLLGDSITEHWTGADLGSHQAKWDSVHDAFNSNFNKTKGGKIDGLALGIGGDKCEQLLYRLDNGELPDNLQAKVYWILVGTNDIGAWHCSGESVAAGNIRIAEELLRRKPNATIVLNSFLPRGKLHFSWLDAHVYNQTIILNQWLECYAASNPRVSFFNATDIFLAGENNTELIPEYYSDDVHPSGEGSDAWAQAIVNFVEELTS